MTNWTYCGQCGKRGILGRDPSICIECQDRYRGAGLAGAIAAIEEAQRQRDDAPVDLEEERRKINAIPRLPAPTGHLSDAERRLVDLADDLGVTVYPVGEWWRADLEDGISGAEIFDRSADGLRVYLAAQARRAIHQPRGVWEMRCPSCGTTSSGVGYRAIGLPTHCLACRRECQQAAQWREGGA